MASQILYLNVVALVFTSVFCLYKKTMSRMSNVNLNKRKRQTEVKKWTEDEVKKVLNYMQVHRNVEKPTAQLYYRKLLESTQIDSTWHCVKCKVRHLKSTFQKADAWSKSTGAGVEDGDGTTTVKDKMLKMCPYYEELSDIFSSCKEIDTVLTMDTSNYTDYEFIDDDDSVLVEDESQSSSADVSFANKVKRRAKNSCFEKMASMEAERTNFRGKQLQLETEKLEWSKEIEKNKMEIEKNKIEIEKSRIEIEKQKMENDLEIRKLELEQKERLTMYEVNLKYKK